MQILGWLEIKRKIALGIVTDEETGEKRFYAIVPLRGFDKERLGDRWEKTKRKLSTVKTQRNK